MQNLPIDEEHQNRIKKSTSSATVVAVNKKVHQCNVCHKAFEYQSGLQRHFRVHTGEKPYACHVCGKGFSQATHVQKHLLSAHLPVDNGTTTTYVVLNAEERAE